MLAYDVGQANLNQRIVENSVLNRHLYVMFSYSSVCTFSVMFALEAETEGHGDFIPYKI